MDILYFYTFLVAAGAGCLGVMCGFGGGIFLVPVLSVILGVPLKTAIATSALCVVVNSLVGARNYLNHSMVNVRLSLLLQTTTTIGVLGGAALVLVAPVNILNILFALTLYVVIGLMLRSPGEHAQITQCADPLNLTSSYVDAASTERVTYIPQRIKRGVGLSTIGGIVSGIMGIGGGPIQVPVMTVMMGIPIKAAAATSTFLVGATASTSAVIYLLNGLIDYHIAAAALAGILVGATVGANLARHVSPKVLRYIVACVLAVLATMILVQAF